MLIILLFAAQTIITPPDNKYSPADVKLGQDAAAQAEQQLAIMRDDEVTSYVSSA